MACRFWQVARILYLGLGLLMTSMLLRVNGPRNHGKRCYFIALEFHCYIQLDVPMHGYVNVNVILYCLVPF